MSKAVSIESLILANHIEVVNGLLYVSGGGWGTHIRMMQPDNTPPQSQFGIALIAAVQWHQTNQDHQFIIELRDEDAKSLATINAKLNVGRSPGMRPGAIQYSPIAVPITLTFPRSGGYEIVASIEGVDGSERRWAFQVQDVSLATAA